MFSQDSYSFREYINEVFKDELNEYAQRLINYCKDNDKRWPSECSHHGVPADRTLLFEWGTLNGCEPKFICALYVTTLLHKAVHAQSRPELPSRWLTVFGAHQLPMHPHGFGCFKIVVPSMILRKGLTTEREVPAELWEEVCEYILNDVPYFLIEAGIKPDEFFKELINDKEFGTKNACYKSKYELILEKHLVKKWCCE